MIDHNDRISRKTERINGGLNNILSFPKLLPKLQSTIPFSVLNSPTEPV
jgi:hypothetical protein